MPVAYAETLPIALPCAHCRAEMPAGSVAYDVPRVGRCHRACAQAAWDAVRAPEIAAEAAAREAAMARTGIRPGSRVRRRAYRGGLVGVVERVDSTHARVAWPSNRLGGDGRMRTTLRLSALALAEGDGR